MRKIRRLRHSVQAYAWGCREAIPRLLGQKVPAPEPQAELWMGAHPKAPSHVEDPEERHPLPAWIARDPNAILGASTVERFGPTLPFLFKVLAAAKPLSIQAHPNLAQAKAGFARENELGIPIDAYHRNYRDANHKPELICAMTPFWALRGFRAIEEILSLLDLLAPPTLAPLQKGLQKRPDRSGLMAFFDGLMSLPTQDQGRAVQEALAAVPSSRAQDPTFSWMQRLQRAYPDDVGVLSPLLLNLLELQPGEAMFLPAGELHAYLEGTGIEIMANSDNVLRGGLTPKHVDVPELRKTLTFTSGPISFIEPTQKSATETSFATPAEEFALSRLEIGPSTPHNDRPHGVQILLCTKGECILHNAQGEPSDSLKQGDSILVPASTSAYSLHGKATLYKATIPQRS